MPIGRRPAVTRRDTPKGGGSRNLLALMCSKGKRCLLACVRKCARGSRTTAFCGVARLLAQLTHSSSFYYSAIYRLKCIWFLDPLRLAGASKKKKKNEKFLDVSAHIKSTRRPNLGVHKNDEYSEV